MIVKKVTKTHYELEDGRVFEFDEPLEKVPTPNQLQKMLDANAQFLEGMKNDSDNQ